MTPDPSIEASAYMAVILSLGTLAAGIAAVGPRAVVLGLRLLPRLLILLALKLALRALRAAWRATYAAFEGTLNLLDSISRWAGV